MREYKWLRLIGMRTRSMAVEEAAGEKRRKVSDGELLTSITVRIATEDTRGRCDAAVSPSSDDHVPVTCVCSSNRSTEEPQFTDLEESVTPSTCRSDTGLSGSPTTNITANQTSFISSGREVLAEKLPPATELEEFFTSAEKQLHKRFKEKYNYDIGTDAPLEGRFEWVQLKS